MKIHQHADKYMRPIDGLSECTLDHNDNRWVKLEDAAAFGKRMYADGHEAGAYKVQPQPRDIESYVPATSAILEDIKSTLTSDDSDRKRLLNELYHDRARLERQVQQAVQLMDMVLQLASEHEWLDNEDELVVNDYPLMGSLQQFADSHRGD